MRLKTLSLLLASVVLALGCSKSKSPTEPNDHFDRYYVDFYVYAGNGANTGQPIGQVQINYRDSTWSKFGQLITGVDGHAPRQEWPGEPGPLNVDARVLLGHLQPYHVEGDFVTCHADPLHSEDAICTYQIPLLVEPVVAK